MYDVSKPGNPIPLLDMDYLILCCEYDLLFNVEFIFNDNHRYQLEFQELALYLLPF